MLKKLALLLLFLPLAAHSSITLTTPPTVPSPNGSTISNVSIPNVACYEVKDIGNRTTGTSTVNCWYGTITVSGTDQAIAKQPGIPPIVVSLNWGTGLNTVTFRGVILYSTTLTGAGLTNATATFQGGVLSVRNAVELYLITSADTGGTAILQGTQNDQW